MTFFQNPASRRTFLKSTAGTVAGLAAYPSLIAAGFTDKVDNKSSVSLGVFASYNHASYLKELGCTYIEESVGGFLIPQEGESKFDQNLRELQMLKFPIWSYVILLPGELKTLGPDANHEAILLRTELALKRAKECGSHYIVFGSGGSRIIPDGFDRDKAKSQHIELTRKMAPLAEKYGITIAVEPLNRGETNFINSLAEGVEIIEAVKSPRVRLLCDIYHMLKEDEPATEIIKYGKHIVHCHIAEKESRTPPGVKGDDFRPYLGALKKIGYTGGLSIECFKYTDFDSEVKKGIEVLRKQLSEV
ncbi:sugar phosphate isomerase/epimerase [Dyadobacter sp. NIV53]|uniref:sugar phosphate isomerase/epimerase family protein n=1 Tax=Dyadobacter sp. NIV53 TaxID=2861765 RepID=UPI001C88C866|nr:sugar phosphate isomerase/epimerase family protein [Dyadobacter sp. NIV53]